jgi:hypothetical protein
VDLVRKKAMQIKELKLQHTTEIVLVTYKIQIPCNKIKRNISIPLLIGDARIVQRFSIKINPQFHIKCRGGKTWGKGHTSYMYEISDFCT